MTSVLVLHVVANVYIYYMSALLFKVGDATTCVNENSTGGQSTEAIHKCLECNKTFKKRSQMERHQRIHTG